MKIYRIIILIILVISMVILNNNSKRIGIMEIEINKQESEIAKLENQKEQLENILQKRKIEAKTLTELNNLLMAENEKLKTIRAKLTAYSPLDNVDGQQSQGNPTRTSTGKQVSRGIVAADPKKLPYGTRLEIPDWGVVEVGDTGGKLRNDNKNIRIDLFHETYRQAISYGIKDMDIRILEWGDNLQTSSRTN